MKHIQRTKIVCSLSFLCTILIMMPNATAAPTGLLEPLAPPPVGDGKLYALIVGISDYEDSTGISDLYLPDEDANDWYTYLKYTEYFDTIRVLGDDTSYYSSYYALATEDNIKSSLNWLRTVAVAGDTVAVIFIGHGDKTSYLESYYLAWDGNHLDDNELASYLDDVVAQHVFVFLDCCRSGGFLGDLQAMANHAYVFATSACAWDGVSYEDPAINNGLWTFFYINEYAYLNALCLGVEPAQELVYTGAYQDLLAAYSLLPSNRPQLYDGNTNLKFLLGYSD